MQEQKRFFASLFDFGFSELITPRIIRVVFIIGIVFIALSSLTWLFTIAEWMGGAGIIMGLIFSGLSFLLGVVALRMWLEVIMVIFRIADDLSALRASGGPPKA